MTYSLKEAEKRILGALLADFTDRNLESKHLLSGYEGPKLAALIAAVLMTEDITKTDFDLAMNDLEAKKLVRTGPIKQSEHQGNYPGVVVLSIGGYSTREYAYLTEIGYKAARDKPNRPSQAARITNNVTISGVNNSSIQLAAGSGITQNFVSGTEANNEVLLKLIEILERQGQVVTNDQRKDLGVVLQHAEEGDLKSAKETLLKIGGPVWKAALPVMWEVIAEVAKKAAGF